MVHRLLSSLQEVLAQVGVGVEEAVAVVRGAPSMVHFVLRRLCSV